VQFQFYLMVLPQGDKFTFVTRGVFLYDGSRDFPRDKGRQGREADPSSPSSVVAKKSRVIPLLPLWAVQSVQSLSACAEVYFTFTFT